MTADNHTDPTPQATTEPAPATVPPPATATPAKGVTLTTRTEFPSVQAAQSAPQDIIALAHLEAPDVDVEKERSKPLRLSAVIDVSGSMRGEKLRLAKESLSFIVDELKDRDEFGIVAFESSVFTVLPVTQMTVDGKARARSAIASLREMGCTNLSGGLFMGIDQVLGKESDSTPTPFHPGPMRRTSHNNHVSSKKVARPPLPTPFNLTVKTQHSTMKRGGATKHCYWMQLEGSPAAVSAAVVKTPKGDELRGADIALPPSDAPIAALSVTLPTHNVTFAHGVKGDVEEDTQTYNVSNRSAVLVDGSTVTAPTAPTATPAAVAGKTHSRAVMIFTDGQANNGITDTGALVAETKRRLGEEDSMDVTVYTFGFGASHNVDMLRGIADASQGSYYFIENTECMKEAFADCLGGLVSIVAQNLVLKVTCGGATVTISNVMTQYPVTGSGDKREVKMKDLYGGEKRDLLVRLRVADAAAADALELVRFELSYEPCTAGVAATAATSTGAASVAVKAEKYEGKPDTEIDEQRNRIDIAEALVEARRLADNNDRESARRALCGMKSKVAVSSSAATPMMAMMQEQMDDCMDAMESESVWNAKGSKATSNMAQMHMQQRCSALNSAGDMYTTGAKKAMRMKSKGAM